MFEKFIINARTERYNIMCSIDAHEKQQSSFIDDGSSGGGNNLPSDLTTESLVSLSETIDFIYCSIKCSEHNSL